MRVRLPGDLGVTFPHSSSKGRVGMLFFPDCCASLVLSGLGGRAEPTAARLQPERCASSREVVEEQDVELIVVADEEVLLPPGAFPVKLETFGVLLIDLWGGPRTPDVRLHHHRLVAAQPALHGSRAVQAREVRAHHRLKSFGDVAVVQQRSPDNPVVHGIRILGVPGCGAHAFRGRAARHGPQAAPLQESFSHQAGPLLLYFCLFVCSSFFFSLSEAGVEGLEDLLESSAELIQSEGAIVEHGGLDCQRVAPRSRAMPCVKVESDER